MSATHEIKARFHDIYKVSLGKCIDEIGVYVLWSDGARAKPSYIGEGNLVARIGCHLTDERKPFRRSQSLEGCACVLDGPTIDRRKWDAQIVEHSLLSIAEDLGIRPAHNKSPGSFKAVRRRCNVKGSRIKIRFSGVNPLERSDRKRAPATVWWWMDRSPTGEELWWLESPWSIKRLR